MKDKDFERIMQAWADGETESAPRMRPTVEMYRSVRAKRKKTGFFAYRRWAVAGAAAACLAVLVVSYSLFTRPSGDYVPFEETAFVGLREGSSPEPEGTTKKLGAPPGRREKKGPVAFRQLVLRLQRQGSQSVESIDLKSPQREPVALADSDSYRLLLEPAQDRHVYVFQLTASGVLVRLHPNETYSAQQNPLRAGRTYHLPPGRNWLHLTEDKGEERLYVAASAQPLSELSDLYSIYKKSGDSSRQEILTSLLETLDTIEEAHPGDARAWVLPIDHQ